MNNRMLWDTVLHSNAHSSPTIAEITLIFTSPSVHGMIHEDGRSPKCVEHKKIYISWERCSIRVNCLFSIILTKAIACWSVSILQRLRLAGWDDRVLLIREIAGQEDVAERQNPPCLYMQLSKRPWAGAMNDEYVSTSQRYKFVTKENPILFLLHIKGPENTISRLASYYERVWNKHTFSAKVVKFW